MSRVKPGYFTDFNAFFTCSSETDISATYARRARGKPRARAQQAKRQSSLSVLVIHLVANLILVSARGVRRLLAPFCYKVWVLPVGPGAVFRPHWIGRQLKPENSVRVAGEFQHEEPLRSPEIKFDVTRAHSCILRRVGVPVSRHRHPIARCIKLGLNVSQTFDGLTRWRLYFELQLRRRSIDVQNMRLTGIPNSKSGHRNDTKGNANGYQPDEKPKSSCAAPIKRQKNHARRDDARHDECDCSGKIISPAFKRGDVKRSCQCCAI